MAERWPLIIKICLEDVKNKQFQYVDLWKDPWLPSSAAFDFD